MVFLVFLVIMVILFLLMCVYFRRDYKSGVISKEIVNVKGKVMCMLSVFFLGVVIWWGLIVFIFMFCFYNGFVDVVFDIVLIFVISIELMKFMNLFFNLIIFVCYILNFRKDWFGLCKNCKCCGKVKDVENLFI